MIKNAIHEKIATAIKNGNLFEDITREIDKVIICFIIFAVLFYGQNKINEIFFQYRLFVFLWISINIFAFFDTIVSLCVSIRRRIKQIQFDFPVIDWEFFEGVAKRDMIKFLMDEKAFPFKKIYGKFGFAPKDYKRIGDNLERVGILIRWENNARILNPNISESKLNEILNNENSDEITPPLVQSWNSFNYEKL